MPGLVESAEYDRHLENFSAEPSTLRLSHAPELNGRPGSHGPCHAGLDIPTAALETDPLPGPLRVLLRVLVAGVALAAIASLSLGGLLGRGEPQFGRGNRDAGQPLPGTPTFRSAVATASASTRPTVPRTTLVNETFDLLPMESRPAEGWTFSTDALGAAAVAPIPTGVQRSLRLRASADGAVEACRSLGAADGDVLQIELEVLIEGSIPREADLALADLRAADESVASVALDALDGLVYTGGDGGATGGELTAGDWYRSVVVLHLTGARYDLEVRDVATDTALVARTDLPWRTGAQRVDEICFRVPAGAGEATLYIDSLVVRG